MKLASSEPVSVQAPPTPAPRIRLLDKIKSPSDLKALPESDLAQLAHEVREELIYAMSETNPHSVGGHLGPNLGVVELTIALHRVFSTPKDKFVFDVSHQAYVHKMFTAGSRHADITSIRQYQGLNGFMLRSESEHDCYGAGHAGTALSAGLGMAVGRDQRGGDENVVVVAGDAAFTCGVSYEALNNVVESNTKKFIVVLNDNEWSIAKNVGAMAGYFNRIATSPTYQHLHDQAARFIEAIGGKGALKLAGKVEAGVKNLLLPSVIFEDLGLRYYGPIDGHDTALADQDFRVPQSAGGAGHPPHPHEEGQGLPACAGAAGQIPRPGQIQAGNRRDRQGDPGDVLGNSRRYTREFRRQQPEDRGHHRRHAQRHGTRTLPETPSRRNTSMSASPRNTRRCSLADWPSKDSSRFWRSTRHSCSARTT